MKNDESIAMTALYNIKVCAEGLTPDERMAVLGSASVIKHELRDLEEENKFYHKIIMWCCGLAGVCLGGCLVMLVNIINII